MMSLSLSLSLSLSAENKVNRLTQDLARKENALKIVKGKLDAFQSKDYVKDISKIAELEVCKRIYLSMSRCRNLLMICCLYERTIDLSLSLSLTHTPTHALSHTHTHTHTHTLSLSV